MVVASVNGRCYNEVMGSGRGQARRAQAAVPVQSVPYRAECDEELWDEFLADGGLQNVKVCEYYLEDGVTRENHIDIERLKSEEYLFVDFVAAELIKELFVDAVAKIGRAHV